MTRPSEPAVEAARFFRNEAGFRRLFCEMRKKYESLGRVGGTISLVSFTKDEKEAVAAFFGKEMTRVSLTAFAKQLEKTRFAGVTLEELLTHYFGAPLIANKERREAEQQEKAAFFQRLIAAYPSGAEWLAAALENPNEYRLLHQAYAQQREELCTSLCAVCEALRQLPEKGVYERLPLFAQKVTGDPHAFDLHTFQGKLLLSALEFYSRKKYQLSSVEEVNELLQSFGILREDILNFVTCAGILAETENGVHPVFAAASETNMPLNVPLREIVKLKRAHPSKGTIVFVVENAGVFSELLDEAMPLVSTNGQLNLATMLLLDLLAESGARLYYSGDFDPEGLKMADRLAGRYGKKLFLWHFTREDYFASMPSVSLSEERLARLQSVSSRMLQPVKMEMEQLKKAGYQEAILLMLRTDMKRRTDLGRQART
ncbi:TIGR02679 family protein [Caenibacillus caldisaponilyticus]|uniref:TIGR02679 family protein n=1 Tax=Caenibacillus caldisaponilyticus TaxID=1674942 RepID=UPI00098851F9|nr:TIGR02679 family protein [Caenibacillus caldisaponilyticus]